MSHVHEILKEIGVLAGNPRDTLSKERLKAALKMASEVQFAHQLPDADLGFVIWRAARGIVVDWTRETRRMTWIEVAALLVRRMEKPKALPRPKPGEGADMKARAAGEGAE
jgi:hypothetical protein